MRIKETVKEMPHTKNYVRIDPQEAPLLGNRASPYKSYRRYQAGYEADQDDIIPKIEGVKGTILKVTNL